MLLTGFGWLLAYAADVLVVQQLALIILLILAGELRGEDLDGDLLVEEQVLG